MFGYTIGDPRLIAGEEFLVVRKGGIGHALSGPYEHRRPGSFRADFRLALGEVAEGGDDPVCAIIDVSASGGLAVLAQRDIRRSELSGGLRTFSLTFALREFRALEYRVYTTGSDVVIVGAARVQKLSMTFDPPPEADPHEQTLDPHEQHRQVRSVLRLLRPQRVKGHEKTRLGHLGDGGYVCIDDFAGIDTAFSFGINDDISWDTDMADRGLIIHQFDHTVEDPAPNDPRMHFNKKMIAPERGPTAENIEGLVALHDAGKPRPNLILKIDIEGHEWAVFNATSDHAIGRFSQILCELHYFQGLADPYYRSLIYDGLRKINQHYAVAHVHANVCGGISNIGNVIFPNVLEIAFVNRAIYDVEDTDELFPGPLDLSCDANQPDMYLGSFRF